MNVLSAEVFDPVDNSLYKAPFVEGEITRDAPLATLEKSTKGQHKFILVEGEEGIGKTVLLSQFVKLVKKDCVALFIDPINRNSYREESLLADIFMQVKTYCGEDVEFSDFSEKELYSSLQTLQYLLNKKRKPFYIVIDGLDALPVDSEIIIKKVFDVLPVSSREIKFVFSVCSGELSKLIDPKHSDTIKLMLLSTLEAREMLPELSKEQVSIILDTFPRLPSTIGHIKRLFKSGITFDEVVENNGEVATDLYELEWESNKNLVDKHGNLLSILSHCENELTVTDLSKMCEMTESDIFSVVDSIKIIKIEGDFVNFVSPGMKKFAIKEFGGRKSDDANKIVEHLLSRPDDIVSLTSIPDYFKKSGQNLEIINQLDNTNIKKVLDLSKSFGGVVKQINYGIEASHVVESETDLLRFSHLKAFITDSTSGEVLTSELLSHLEVDDVKSALDLASSAKSNEEEIQLFAKIAKYQSDKGVPLVGYISDQITLLYRGIDPKYTGVEKAIDIAIDLFPVFPDFSLSLINRIDTLGVGGENKSDYAFLRFSLALLDSNDGSFEMLEEKSDSLKDKKKSFFSTLSLFKRGTPASKIISKVDALVDATAGDKLFMLRNWIKAFYDMEDNYSLVEKAISLAVATTSFSANAGFYLDMTCALPYMSAEHSLDIYKKICVQIDTLREMGPTIDYIKVEIALINFESSAGISSGRLDKLYRYTAFDISDKAIALCALSILSKYVVEKGISPYCNDIRVAKDMMLSAVVSNTANQFDILKPALIAESEVDYVRALKWSDSLNIQGRRDEARACVISAACKNSASIEISSVCADIKKIQRYSLRRRAFLSLINSCLDRSDITKSQFKRLRKAKNSISDGVSPCLILAKLIKIGVKNQCCTDHELDNIKDELREYWSKIDAVWSRVDVGFKIHNLLVEYDEDFSQKLKDESVALRKEVGSESEAVLRGLCDTSDLALRALGYLVASGNDSRDDLRNMVEIITSLPATLYKVKQFSRLASVYQLNNKQDELGVIVETHLLPALEPACANVGLFKACLGWAMPVIFRYSAPIFEDYLSKVEDDHEYTDGVVGSSVKYIYQKTIVGDPFEAVKNFSYNLSFKEVKEILSLIGYLNLSPSVYYEVNRLSIECAKLIKDRYFSKDQVNVIRDQFSSLIEDKINGSDFIGHEGYYYCSLACLYHICQERSRGKWADLVALSRSVNNKSDLAFILYSIAESMPVSCKDDARMLISEAFVLIDEVPSFLDRLDRYQGLSESARKIDKVLAKNVLKKAVLLSATDETQEFESKRNQLIDTAYAIDKDFPSTLAAIIDTDTARCAAIKESVDNQRIAQENSDSFQMDHGGLKKPELLTRYPDMAWSLFTKINGNSYVPKQKGGYLDYLLNIPEFGLRETYPLITYYLACNSLRYKTKADVVSKIRPLFAALLSNFSLLLDIYDVDYCRLTPELKKKDNVLINPGDESKAIEYVQQWMSAEGGLDSITIIDPYLTLDDLTFIGECIQKDPNYSITILTSMERMTHVLAGRDEDVSDVLYDYWNDNISSDAVPSIKIIFAGLKSMQNKIPIHDRWWLSNESGVRFGGSMNGLGGMRVQEISKVTLSERVNIDNEVQGFVSMKQKKYKNERIKYTMCSI